MLPLCTVMLFYDLFHAAGQRLDSGKFAGINPDDTPLSVKPGELALREMSGLYFDLPDGLFQCIPAVKIPDQLPVSKALLTSSSRRPAL